MKIDDLTFLFSKPLFHTKYNDIPIKVKRVVQTGPKSQLGGVKLGFCNVTYQVEIAEIVNMVPILPIN